MTQREIKFRAIVLDDDGGDSLRYNVWPTGDDSCFVPDGGFWMRYSVLMQYSGLKDKAGKEIYEGDIISDKWKAEVYVGPDGAFMVSTGYGKAMSLLRFIQNRQTALCGNEIEVIGNIFEHKHLIK